MLFRSFEINGGSKIKAVSFTHPNIDNTASTGPTVKLRKGWIRIRDELVVSDVRPEDVFGTPERDDRCQCAYLLFYRPQCRNGHAELRGAECSVSGI